jgi:hypothetical protein
MASRNRQGVAVRTRPLGKAECYRCHHAAALASDIWRTELSSPIRIAYLVFQCRINPVGDE